LTRAKANDTIFQENDFVNGDACRDGGLTESG
jgi:hypothetical protein